MRQDRGEWARIGLMGLDRGELGKIGVNGAVYWIGMNGAG